MTGAAEFTLNGAPRRIEGDPDRTLLDALRNEAGLTATRFGCGEGSCGACHVIVDGRAVASCGLQLAAVAGKSVTTLEGLGSAEAPHPLQQAFIDEQAMQCGYCVSGVIMTAAALLAANPDPSEREVRAALSGNLCRCGAHNRMVRAVLRAARTMSAAHG
ncbi:MAG: (2Fe-2S)-binding protein [Beijerinckiaceae bacterium]